MGGIRKRGQNFTLEERKELVKLISLHKSRILNKQTDGAANAAKCKSWNIITSAFNSKHTVSRSKDSLMKLWEKLKSESKLFYNNSHRNPTSDGDTPNPSINKRYDLIMEQVCALLGRPCNDIANCVTKSDQETNKVLEQNESEPLQEMNNLDDQHKILGTDSNSFPITENINENGDSHSINIRKEWSIKRQQIDKRNRRIEHFNVANLCTSSLDISKQNNNIDELKEILLEEEIEFKRKLYELQLQAAAKEIEIKNEMLKQLKEGRPLNNYNNYASSL